jgi:DNA polymerase-3 subunit beta
MNTAAINLRILSAISAFSSKEETRYYLQGVCIEIEPRSITYVVTDGHRLVAHREELGEHAPDNTLLGSFIIPSDKCRAVKLGKRDEPEATISGAGLDLTITHNATSVGFKCIDGAFPSWKRVVPATKPTGEVAQFNWDYAAAFQKFADALGFGKPAICPSGQNPALVWFPQSPETVGVLMPIRSPDYAERVAPEWAAEPMLEAAA